MNRNKEDLKVLLNKPLEEKIQITIARIIEWYEYWNGQVYVSFSGGKDSTVLKHIVDSIYDDVPAVFANTGLEYPEVRKFVMSQNNITVVKPKLRFDETIKKYGYPVISKEIGQVVECARKEQPWAIRKLNGLGVDGQPSPYAQRTIKYKYLVNAPFNSTDRCCHVMKKRPFKSYETQTKRKGIVGTMTSESLLRQNSWMKYGCNAFSAKHPISAPISFWTEQDVLEYIVTRDIPYASVYGEIKQNEDGKYYTTGCDRTGCMFCAFGAHLEKEPNRFQKLKETHPRQYEYCIGGGEYVDGLWVPNKEGLGLGKVLDYIGVKYE